MYMYVSELSTEMIIVQCIQWSHNEIGILRYTLKYNPALCKCIYLCKYSVYSRKLLHNKYYYVIRVVKRKSITKKKKKEKRENGRKAKRKSKKSKMGGSKTKKEKVK